MKLKSLNLKASEAAPFSADTCVWLVFCGKSGADSQMGEFVDAVDWSMKGAISGFKRDAKARGQATFIPTLGRMPSPMLVLQLTTDSSELTQGISAIENLGFQKAILWIEEESVRKEWEKELKNRNSSIQQVFSVHP